MSHATLLALLRLSELAITEEWVSFMKIILMKQLRFTKQMDQDPSTEWVLRLEHAAWTECLESPTNALFILKLLKVQFSQCLAWTL